MTIINCFGVAFGYVFVVSSLEAPRRLVRSAADVAINVAIPARLTSDRALVANVLVKEAKSETTSNDTVVDKKPEGENEMDSEATKAWCAKGVVSLEGDTCCDLACGTCSGADCWNRPGGSTKCCGGHITRKCTDYDDVACEIPASPYVELALNANGCPAGTEISSEFECNAAVSSLGYTGSMSKSSDNQIPVKCSLKKAKGQPHWNSASSGQGREDLAPICKADAPNKAEMPAWSPLSPQPFEAQPGELWETKVDSDCELLDFQNESKCPVDCSWEKNTCVKRIYVLQWSAQCEHPITDAERCFRARQRFQPGADEADIKETSEDLPGGCSILTDSWKTNFNSNTNSSAACDDFSTCVCEKAAPKVSEDNASTNEDQSSSNGPTDEEIDEDDWEKRLAHLKDNATNGTAVDMSEMEMNHYTKVVFSLFGLFLILGVAVKFKKNESAQLPDEPVKEDDFDDAIPVFGELVDKDGHAVK